MEFAMPSPFTFTISRTFHVPRARMWEMWTQADELKHWFGPKGFPITHCFLDLKPGGFFHYGMALPEGGNMWGKWVFQTIRPPEELVFVVTFADETGTKVIRHPWNATWPLEMLSRVRFID